MMKDECENLDRLREMIDREIERHPHCEPLLKAFRPVILERNRVLLSLQPANLSASDIDALRFSGGIPIIGQYRLFQENDPWKDIVLAMIPAVQEGFPDLREDLSRFAGALQEGKINLYQFFRQNHEDEKENIIKAWAEKASIAQQGVALVLNQAARIILEKRAGEIEPLIRHLTWGKGYCPICGSYPALAVIGEKVGERQLHCSHCGHNWLFSRVICPYCDHEGQEGMNFFFIEETPQESVYTCEQCRRYLVTLNRVSALNDRNLDISAMGLTHLDIILQEKEFIPMTVTDWNVL